MWDARFEEVLRPYLPFLPADEPLTPESSLRDLGLDSLGTVELLGALEHEFGVRFVDDALSLETFANAGVLWAALDNLLKQAA
ncbi:acyl carrier protein [Kutzneria buriramensis]|jgi:acyl carrier protein|uniref:Acyl carrier protein n=1 Tax=Kutzneria buriramensis TaxID=1045776 RepID=A0A3E0I5D9_9PSEU|nr:acyl carrier protein [Kutzneria buriramensis]REH53974.1 acyl carrier protein [Kutzneria buriramensis]